MYHATSRPLVMSLPNILTYGRIIAVPGLVACLFFLHGDLARWSALVLFVTASLTDWLDGYLARKLGQTSALGAFLDPVADKLMVATALILLVSYDPPTLEFFVFDPHILITLTAAVIVGREITISALREWMAEIGARGKVAVSWIGKWKTGLQMTGLSMMLFRSDVWILPAFEVGLYCLVAAAALTLWSMVMYVKASWAELTR